MDLTQVVIVALTTAGTILGSSASWKYWEMRTNQKAKKEANELRDDNLYRDDLRERVAVMESKLLKSDQEKQDLQKEMIRLVEKIAALSVEVEFLRKENTELRHKLGYNINN